MTTNIISDSLENSSETYDMRFYKKKNENTSWVARPIAQKICQHCSMGWVAKVRVP